MAKINTAIQTVARGWGNGRPIDGEKEIHGRQFGLGAAPITREGLLKGDQLAPIGLAGVDRGSLDRVHGQLAGAQWANAINCPLSSVPVLEYVTTTYALPLTDAQIAVSFGAQVPLLTQQGAPPGAVSVDTSFAINGLLQTNMFCCGLGVHVFGEPISFTQIGNSISSAITTLPISPDVWTANDLAHGALGSFTTGITPAVMEWGFADWQAIYHMTNAYQFQWRFCQRYLLLNELVADLAFYGPYAEGQGFGTSDVFVQQYVNQINGLYGGSEGGTANEYFLPVNYRRIGSVNANATTGSGPIFSSNVGVYHPTRDFDLAPCSFGGLKVHAGSGAQPFRKFSKPIYLPAGNPIGASLYVQDNYHWTEMQRYLSISENSTNGANKTAVVQISTGYSGNTAPGSATAGLELTLDQGGNQFSQQIVNTDRVLYKGGVIKTAVLLKGFEVGGEWLKMFSSSASSSQLSQQVWCPGRENNIGVTR